jgi:hypothetical protein
MIEQTENDADIVDQDEILGQCEYCQAEYTVAYWDEELEYYIYLSDGACCSRCETVGAALATA